MTRDSSDNQFRQPSSLRSEDASSLDEFRIGGSQFERLASLPLAGNASNDFTISGGTLYVRPLVQLQGGQQLQSIHPGERQSGYQTHARPNNQPQWFGKDGQIMRAPIDSDRSERQTEFKPNFPRNNQALSDGSAAGNERRVMNFFIERGLSREQAAGIAGNIAHESPGSRPDQRQFGGGPGYGIAQWEGSRLRALKSFAAEQSSPVSDLETQLKFMWKELNTTEKNSLAAIKRAQTASSAAQIFERNYERAGRPNVQARQGHAGRILAQFTATDGRSNV
ncbi:hypothetical protein BH10CYA1_BH10CYA1_09610 [soil metagenome]